MNEREENRIQHYDRDHVFHPLSNPREMLDAQALILERGKGIYVYDLNGQEYLDGMAGLWNVNVGYGRTELAAVAEEQMKKLSFAPLFWGRGNRPAAELAEKLSSLLPGELNHFHFTSGGSESNETAFKIARYYWRMKGKPEKSTLIACSRGYHGVSQGALGATGLAHFVEPFGNRPPGYAHIPSPYCYRCPFEMKYPQCGLACAHALQECIRKIGADRVAAFVIEPVEGAGGVIIPPAEYLPIIHRICRENDILLIFDEVITGFGRTGTMFATLRYDFEPDMISMAKGITSGYLPLGAVAVSQSLYRTLAQADRVFFHGFTYSGHPVACAVALRNIAILEEENLPQNAAERGKELEALLQRTFQRHPHVGGIRVQGLIGALEIVEEKESGRSFPPERKMGEKVGAAARSAGLILRPIGDILAFSPPLIINDRQVEQLVERMKTAIHSILGEA